MSKPNIFDPAVGLLRIGNISSKGYNPANGKTFIELNDGPASSASTIVEVNIPLGLFYNNGLCIGTKPKSGTPVIIGQGYGGEYFFVSFCVENTNFLPELNSDELLVSANDNTKITLDLNNDIYIGSYNNRVHINSVDNIFATNFDNNYNFTQASRKVNGIVKRDIRRNTQIPQSFKLDKELYESMFFTIGLDPLTTPNAIPVSSRKNPPFVEKREMIYEFQYSANVGNELSESTLYSDKKIPTQTNNFINRRQSRSDTLSLTLAEPNYLMETVKGTIIDIFGNILDLNRVPLSIGQGQNTLRAEKSADKTQSYLKIRELERRSLAYHFEINARKDLTGIGGKLTLPDINSNSDYARTRSRFFIDIDKEGQFKINVPASSEKGNIPLLTRYENFSTFGTDNPNKLIYREDNLDIFQDSFAAPSVNRYNNNNLDLGPTNRGSIIIKDGDAQGTPIDRITNDNIKHGTAYHDILSTCYTHLGTQFINYQNDNASERNIDIDAISSSNDHLNNIASDTINISGDNANAGGRSGSINLDGSLEFSIGANTIDRQSLWMDLAGGIVANVGRDLKNKSLAMNMDGDVYIQLGGIGVSTDSRFVKQNNGNYGAVLDLRVMTDGIFVTMIRIDKNGVQVLTPGCVQIHGSQGIKLTSDADISIEAETVTIQKRMVLKESGGSI